MANVRPAFLRDCQTQITQVLQTADAWSALAAEFATFATNGIVIAQEDIDAIFGVGIVTVAQFNQALTAQTEVVDYVHIATRAAKLYRVKR